VQLRRVLLGTELLAQHAAHQRVHEQAFAGRIEVREAVPSDQAHRGLEPPLDAYGRRQLRREVEAAGGPEQLP
jgi:hypothetical protein